MPVQTTYGAVLAPGLVGQVVDMRNSTTLSREAAVAAVPFGAVVLRGGSSGDHTCAIVGSAGAGTFLGIAQLDDDTRPINTLNTYAVGDTVAVLIKGAIYVSVTSNVTPGAAAYYDGSGNITATSASNTAIPNGATFETTTASGGVAVLKL